MHRLTCIFAVLIWAMSWENLFLPYVNNKDTDQSAHPCSLISDFVILGLDSIMPLVPISEISSLWLASVAAQAGLSLPWLQTLKTGFLVTWLIWHKQVLSWPASCYQLFNSFTSFVENCHWECSYRCIYVNIYRNQWLYSCFTSSLASMVLWFS